MDDLVTILNFHRIMNAADHPGLPRDRHSIDYPFFLRILDLAAVKPRARITFDDGNASDYNLALPALSERGLKATFFISSGLVGQAGYLHADQVQRLALSGFAIGSHGVLHRDWRTLPDEQLDDEINCSRKDLEGLSAASIGSVSVPFGSYDKRVLRCLRRAGYGHVYTSDGGMTSSVAWIQPRNTILREYTIEVVARLLDRAPGLFLDLRRDVRSLVKRWR